MATIDKIKKLTKALFPTGRAFKVQPGGVREKLIAGLAASEARCYDDCVSILDNILPDNENFTEDDATAWEIRLGLIVSPLSTLEDRKAAIRRKINHPGSIPARQNYRYIEAQLRAAGFDVYVFENRFDDGMGGWETEVPSVITGGSGLIQNQLGDSQLGDSQLGSGYDNIVVNSLDSAEDGNFDVGSNFRSTFFIGGTPIGTFADVDLNREQEFRQLILRLKPVQTVAYLLINYV